MALPAKVVRRILHNLVHRQSVADQCSTEQGAAWYDQVYSKVNTSYHEHYTKSIDYFLWTVVVDRTRTTASVLEIGCGTGQLANYLYDRGVAKYIGFDFSPKAIMVAQASCPHLEFHVADAFTTELMNRNDYDPLICTEVLEHIEADLKVISRVRPGTRCLLTVPSFPYPSHVRYFKDAADVSNPYGTLFSDFRLATIPTSADGQPFYLLDGVRTTG